MRLDDLFERKRLGDYRLELSRLEEARTAWRLHHPGIEKAWLWSKRRPAVAGLAAAFAVAIAVGALAYSQARPRLQATALVERLLDADTPQVLAIVAEMDGYRN